MKIIISHDVDHLNSNEHYFDFILLKYLVRSLIEFIYGTISFSDLLNKFRSVYDSQWHNVFDLINFNNKNNIPSTFFWGMDNALGLNYRLKDVVPIISKVIHQKHNCGVHGIEFNNLLKMEQEKELFSNIVGSKKFGIRMHYLRLDQDTLNKLNQLNYIFDSSMYSDYEPFKIGDMWEFPIQIMDSYEFNTKFSWQSKTTEEIIFSTIEKIKTYDNKDFKYLNIVFHDRNFCKAQSSYMLWYESIISYLKDNGYEFISFIDAIKELEYSSK